MEQAPYWQRLEKQAAAETTSPEAAERRFRELVKERADSVEDAYSDEAEQRLAGGEAVSFDAKRYRFKDNSAVRIW